MPAASDAHVGHLRGIHYDDHAGVIANRPVLFLLGAVADGLAIDTPSTLALPIPLHSIGTLTKAVTGRNSDPLRRIFPALFYRATAGHFLH